MVTTAIARPFRAEFRTIGGQPELLAVRLFGSRPGGRCPWCPRSSAPAGRDLADDLGPLGQPALTAATDKWARDVNRTAPIAGDMLPHRGSAMFRAGTGAMQVMPRASAGTVPSGSCLLAIWLTHVARLAHMAR